MLFLFFAAMVASHTPSPLSISEEKVEALMCDHSVKFDSLHERTKALKSSKISSIIVIVIKQCEFCAFGFFPLEFSPLHQGNTCRAGNIVSLWTIYT